MAEEVLAKILNGFEFLRRVLAAALENVSHLEGILSDGLRHTINRAELRWEMALLAIDLYEEEWLTLVRDLHLVSLKEVLSNAHLITRGVFEVLGDGGLVEYDIHDDVRLLDAPFADN